MSLVNNLTEYYTCDNADEHLLQVLRKAIVQDEDGNVGIRIFIGDGSGLMNNEIFYATPNQTDFTVTTFNLNDNALVFINGALQEFGWTRNDNTIIFNTGLAENTCVVIVN